MKAKAVETEELSTAEREQKVQENAGVKIDDGVYKVDLSKPPTTEVEPEPEAAVEETVEEEVKEEPVLEESTEEPEQETEEVEEVILEEITEEPEAEKQEDEIVEPEVKKEEAIKEEKQDYPENIEELVKFMNETGGTLEDYVKLNKDYADYEDMSLLREYYEKAKPHLTSDEISFLIEDKFSFDEEIDEPKDIKRRKLAFKEEVAAAKNHLEGQKANYYKEIKAGSKLTQDQQKAVDFFNRYNEESEESQKITQQQRAVFNNKTDNLFNDQFKGFEYKVGEKRFRLNIKEADKVKETQSDIGNFVNKFTDNQTFAMKDAKGYHKSLFTAMNPDLVANHFYQQGKADAIKDSMAKAKNVDMSPNQTHGNVIQSGGMKVRAVSGNSSNDFKVKIGRNANKIS